MTVWEFAWLFSPLINEDWVLRGREPDHIQSTDDNVQQHRLFKQETSVRKYAISLYRCRLLWQWPLRWCLLSAGEGNCHTSWKLHCTIKNNLHITVILYIPPSCSLPTCSWKLCTGVLWLKCHWLAGEATHLSSSRHYEPTMGLKGACKQDS